jgi:hypothetical protein
MSVIVSNEMLIVHSYRIPVVFDSVVEPSKRYVIDESGWTEIPKHLGYKHINWFQKNSAKSKNEAFKNNYETEVAGSKGKSYTVKCVDDVWSCTCPAYGWSGNSHTCKHITQVKKDNGWN